MASAGSGEVYEGALSVSLRQFASRNGEVNGLCFADRPVDVWRRWLQSESSGWHCVLAASGHPSP
jgi:hypothetical protein